ncbi:hypothetical protein L1887_47804 [Cichorium endivia]|nr:hypothetical protein L1887_47804 [Cichorium endivia]
MSFDLSLARGLDYYTGLIYEAVTAASAPPGFSGDAAAAQDKAPEKKTKKKKSADGEEEVDESTVGVGSIAAGGTIRQPGGHVLWLQEARCGSVRRACRSVSSACLPS